MRLELKIRVDMGAERKKGEAENVWVARLSYGKSCPHVVLADWRVRFPPRPTK